MALPRGLRRTALLYSAAFGLLAAAPVAACSSNDESVTSQGRASSSPAASADTGSVAPVGTGSASDAVRYCEVVNDIRSRPGQQQVSVEMADELLAVAPPELEEALATSRRALTEPEQVSNAEVKEADTRISDYVAEHCSD